MVTFLISANLTIHLLETFEAKTPGYSWIFKRKERLFWKNILDTSSKIMNSFDNNL